MKRPWSPHDWHFEGRTLDQAVEAYADCYRKLDLEGCLMFAALIVGLTKGAEFMPDRAEVNVEPSPHGAGARLRCTQCNKVAYATEEIVEDAAEKISERVEMDYYLGPCGWYHLTRRER